MNEEDLYRRYVESKHDSESMMEPHYFDDELEAAEEKRLASEPPDATVHTDHDAIDLFHDDDRDITVFNYNKEEIFKLEDGGATQVYTLNGTDLWIKDAKGNNILWLDIRHYKNDDKDNAKDRGFQFAVRLYDPRSDDEHRYIAVGDYDSDGNPLFSLHGEDTRSMIEGMEESEEELELYSNTFNRRMGYS